jgi:hypothetical protein
MMPSNEGGAMRIKEEGRMLWQKRVKARGRGGLADAELNGELLSAGHFRRSTAANR